MFSLAEKWREMDKVRRSPDSAQCWDERSQNYAKDTNDSYARDFVEKMAAAQGHLQFLLRSRDMGLLRQISAKGCLNACGKLLIHREFWC